MLNQRLRQMSIKGSSATEDINRGNADGLVNKDLVRAWLVWSIVHRLADAFSAGWPARIYQVPQSGFQSLCVNAHIASLKQAGLTGAVQEAGYCTSSVPWLLAACKKVVLPIIEFCSTGGPQQAKASAARFQG